MDRGGRVPVRGTYIGVEAIMENVFSRLGSEWDDYKASVNTYHEVSGKDVIMHLSRFMYLSEVLCR